MTEVKECQMTCWSECGDRWWWQNHNDVYYEKLAVHATVKPRTFFEEVTRTVPRESRRIAEESHRVPRIPMILTSQNPQESPAIPSNVRRNFLEFLGFLPFLLGKLSNCRASSYSGSGWESRNGGDRGGGSRVLGFAVTVPFYERFFRFFSIFL